MAKIVFCEDEVLLQKLIYCMMRSTMHEVYIASEGAEGLALIERERPDVIFTDISMPGWDGFQLADALKAQPHLASIPIIFMTAFSGSREKEEGDQHGASGYLIKPFDVEMLQSIVDAALQKAAVSQED